MEGGPKRVTQPTMVQARVVLKVEARHARHKGGMLKLNCVSGCGDFPIWIVA